jgi:type III secretion protein J
MSRAIELLRRQGFPRERFTDLGQIFQKQGLISSPMEERVRYTYGLSQMLAETLTQIDGVLSARVLIVLPEEAAFGQKPAPSSASVFVKYLARPGHRGVHPTHQDPGAEQRRRSELRQDLGCALSTA